jgi:hypothetical protein
MQSVRPILAGLSIAIGFVGLYIPQVTATSCRHNPAVGRIAFNLHFFALKPHKMRGWQARNLLTVKRRAPNMS